MVFMGLNVISMCNYEILITGVILLMFFSFMKSLFGNKKINNQRNELLKMEIDKLKNYEHVLKQLKLTLEKAKIDIGNINVEDMFKMYNSGQISQEQYNELMNAVEVLQVTIETSPHSISLLEKMCSDARNRISELRGENTYENF